MKLMIASDLHGSAFYCRGLLEAWEKEQADRLLFLGDILYHGPRNDLPQEYAPKEVISMLNAHSGRIFSVRGNCEAEVDQMVLRFPVMADYCLLEAKGRLVFATHGHTWNLSNPPALSAGDILLCGHTHIPAKQQENGIFYCNPGSVSIPKGNSPRGYMVLENDRFLWKTLDGTVYDSLEL